MAFIVFYEIMSQIATVYILFNYNLFVPQLLSNHFMFSIIDIALVFTYIDFRLLIHDFTDANFEIVQFILAFT